MAPTSHIRAFVQWKEPTVFSGEEIECVITFKNTARVRDGDEDETDEAKAAIASARANGGLRPRIERQRTVTQSTGVSRGPFSNTTSVAGTSSRFPSFTKGHRPALSLNVVPSPPVHARNASAQSTPQTAVTTATTATSAGRPKPKHSRSLSIMSMGSDAWPPAPQLTSPVTSRRPAARAHGRSASVQIVSSRSGLPSPVIGFPSPRHPSPLTGTDLNTPPFPPSYSFPPDRDVLSIRPNRRKSGINTAPDTPAIVLPAATSPASTLATDFAFPAQSSPVNASHVTTPDFEFPPKNPMTLPKPNRQASHERLAAGGGGGSLNNPITRVLSDVSANGTSRTSSEFYSLDNNSSDTTASEFPSQLGARLLPKSGSSRQSSRNSPTSPDKEPEILMMGYAQTMGSFVLDGSLVNQAPFDEVKRKGVLGGQGGGGVVGVEQRSKRESGFFGSLGWSNVGESLGGLLGGGEMSSIKEMRSVASTKTIPLLSTPQSILFVDLRLSPGQSRSYTYRFQLPRGLPPTHKGRAIKVNYHIKIGVQRSGTLGGHQNIKHIEVPFRVLGSVNNRGESLGHDLMSPYILLHDRARTASIATPDDLSVTILNFPVTPPTTTISNGSSSEANSFFDYANQLLSQNTSRTNPLLSPSGPVPRRRSSTDGPPSNVKEAIDMAILRSNLSSDSSNQPSQSTNRFTIARSGQPVAVISIVRPAYRLGETVSGIVDFTPPPDLPQSSAIIPTYWINITLETIERVDPSLALRSASSVQRATRKVYAHVSESVLFARQTSFRLEIPTSATPTFETTGVRLSWRIRVEFVTARAASTQQVANRGLGISEGANNQDEAGSGGSSDEDAYARADLHNQKLPADDLLEEVMRDDRGVVLIAKENLVAETFEVAVPIRVFGVSGLGVDNLLSGNGQAEPLEV